MLLLHRGSPEISQHSYKIPVQKSVSIAKNSQLDSYASKIWQKDTSVLLSNLRILPLSNSLSPLP